MSWRHVICVGLLFFTSLSGAQAQPALTPVHLAVLPGEVAGEAFYATDMGFFKKHGLDVTVEPMNNGSAVAAAVASGAIDIGLSDVISMSSAHVRGLPFVYLAPGLTTSNTAPTFGILVKGDSTIRDAKDLNGKTITVGALNNISTVPVQAWIDRNGGDSRTVKFLELPLPQEAAAVANGTADAAVPYEPWITLAVTEGERFLIMDKNAIAPEFMLSGWVTMKSWIAKNPATAAKFVAAIRETAQWSNSHRELSAPILSKYTKIPLPVVEKMHRGDFALELTPALVQPVIDAAAKYRAIDRPFPAGELFFKSK
jgi:NitT/TauT family transport system substrate-binding protein